MMKIVMTTGNLQTRFRRSHTKTKTGCDTCKYEISTLNTVLETDKPYRKRRVKCDEKRPFCMKCVSTGRTCQGYHPPKTWIFDPSGKSDNERSVSPTSTNNDESHSSPESIDQNHQSYQNYSREEPLTPMPDIHWATAYREPLLGTFLQKFLSSKSTSSTKRQFTGWPSIACKLSGVPRHEFLTTALMSLALCILSLQEADPSLRASAISIYQQSLPKLRRAISRLLQCQSESLRKAVIAACLVCAQNEYIMEPTSFNARQHLSGVTMIVSHGGTSCLEDEGVRRLFYDHRGLWLNASFESRQVPLHSLPEWRDLPERFTNVVSESIFHSLFKVAAPAIELFAEFDARKAQLTETQLWGLLSRAKQLHTIFEEWRQKSELPAERMLSSAPDTTPAERQNWIECLSKSGLELIITLACFSAYLIHIDKFKLDIFELLLISNVEVDTRISETLTSLKWHVAALRETLPAVTMPEHGFEALLYLPFLLDTFKTGAEASHQLERYDQILQDLEGHVRNQTFYSAPDRSPTIKHEELT